MVTLWLTCLTVISSIKSLTTLTFGIDACSAILTRWVTNTYSKNNYIKNKKGSRRSTKLLTIQPSWLLNPYTVAFFFFLFFFSYLTKPIFFGDAVSSAAMSCMVLSLNSSLGLCLISFTTAYFQPNHPQHVAPGKITKVIRLLSFSNS